MSSSGNNKQPLRSEGAPTVPLEEFVPFPDEQSAGMLMLSRDVSEIKTLRILSEDGAASVVKLVETRTTQQAKGVAVMKTALTNWQSRGDEDAMSETQAREQLAHEASALQEFNMNKRSCAELLFPFAMVVKGGQFLGLLTALAAFGTYDSVYTTYFQPDLLRAPAHVTVYIIEIFSPKTGHFNASPFSVGSEDLVSPFGQWGRRTSSLRASDCVEVLKLHFPPLSQGEPDLHPLHFAGVGVPPQERRDTSRPAYAASRDRICVADAPLPRAALPPLRKTPRAETNGSGQVSEAPRT